MKAYWRNELQAVGDKRQAAAPALSGEGKRSSFGGPLVDAYARGGKYKADQAIAEWVAGSGISPYAASSSRFKEMLLRVFLTDPTYKSPGRRALGMDAHNQGTLGTVLQKSLVVTRALVATAMWNVRNIKV